MPMEGVEERGWAVPVAKSEPSQGLRLNNTLTGSKVPFLTSDGSRRVSWYICGPTVYDASHLGHARNYVTFDIIRRILEGFFNYEVLYVMNVTDVDDKIIQRARKSHLLEQYMKANDNITKVLNDVKNAVEVERNKQITKVEEARKELSNAGSTRQEQELDDKLKQEELKLKKIDDTRSSVQTREKYAVHLEGKAGIDFLFSDGAADVLSSYLDDMDGSKINDLGIFRAHAAKYEHDFFDDMRQLGVKAPDVLTRVTEYIKVITEYIQKIIDNGFAYLSNNSVYFDTQSFVNAGHSYGKLSPWAVGSVGLASESESNFRAKEKRNSADFALWKGSKPGEPFWPSPWGNGRPGWHIECSAMATDILGQTIDIHTGGSDLMFPHHDNELAQAEAYHGCSQWVNYFLHSGHLSIEGLKMSKSLKNFITIKEALEKYTARQIRFVFIIHAWDKPLNFSNEVMSEAIGKEKAFQNFFKIVKNFLRKASLDGDKIDGLKGPQRLADTEIVLLRALQKAQSEVQDRLEDNLDTSGALLALLGLVSAVNSYVDKMGNESSAAMLVKKSAAYVTKILVIFGISNAREGEIGFGDDLTNQTNNTEASVAPYLDALGSFRKDVRDAVKKNVSKEILLEITDKFRDYTMVDLGVRLEDSADGFIWELVDKAVLQNERDEKQRKAREDRLKSLQSKLERKAKDMERMVADSAEPKEMFSRSGGGSFSAFDEAGIPTHDADGKELSKKSRKDVEKKMRTALDKHEKFKQKLAEDPLLMEHLQSEISDLRSQIEQLSIS